MNANDTDLREGEVRFINEAPFAPDGQLRFIGRVRSPWRSRSDCPKNLREARERGGSALLEIAAPYRPALSGLAPGQWIMLLTWLHEARRDLALQAPRHAAEPRGTFSLRSPVRPNPIGLHLVRIVGLDASTGSIAIDAVDVLDGTPLLDIKPYLPSVDIPPMEAD
ncbi:tRNA (N6-threonylcarbamoyladenosine(37)-N6)-methyltransferase TrmO [Aureimonas psammosilenae]|uniref:tRNA (N6-threonylcarbamoyladenosine(37)-N6)-methyltransferase TrmO n=1 Tax=Aureimonas psammosilenae TaxID=2495496 RepID=UPI001260915E|nr:tRNA (N6-threonylcarbamoyladenosine(37)-N6)-methyltransferase TrmO [Aureimonas psammosilenae]